MRNEKGERIKRGLVNNINLTIKKRRTYETVHKGREL